MSTETKQEAKKEKVSVLPFGIEIDADRNADVLLQCIPGCRLRSRLKGNRPVYDQKKKRHVVPVDQSRQLGQIPEVPGMQVYVDPHKCTYEIIDPLYGNEKLCDELLQAAKQAELIRTRGKIDGHEPQKGSLDVHRMKSLCRELFWLLESNDAKLVKGNEPTMEEIEKLPGYFLQNPGSRVYNMQPQFEKDMPAYIQSLQSSGA